MNESPTIFVTGATGKVGGAAVKKLLQENFKVKALCRNPDSEKAKALKTLGADVIRGDLNDINSYEHHLENIDGIFSVQTYENGIDKEIRQGESLADLALKFRVKHFVYSSVIACDLNTGIPHWESKFTIENHIKNIGIPYTIIRPSSFYENFLIPQVRSSLVKGKLVTPLSRETKQHFIAVDDIGRVAAMIFKDPAVFRNKTLTLSSESMDYADMETILSESLQEQVSYKKLPSIITRIFLGKKLYLMFNWIEHNSASICKSIESDKFALKDPISLKQWAATHLL